MQRRGYHDILRNLENQHDLNPWRRAIAEHRVLECYEKIEEELQSCADRKPGQNTKNLAHKKYLQDMFPGAEAEEHHAELKHDLQFGRRWAILIAGYEEGGVRTAGAGLGLYLAASPRVVGIMYAEV